MAETMYHTKELIVKAHGGDDKAREQLVLQNMGLVWSIVKRFAGRGYEQEDLFQIGSIGLMKAIDKFDTSFDVCFSTYAVPMIAGEIKRFLRDDGMSKVSRTLKENAVKSARAIEELRKEKSGEPTIEEVSKKTGLDVCDIVMSFEASADVESLYKTIYQGDGSEILLIDKIEEDKNENDALVDSLVVHDMLNKLPENERKLIVMRYFDEKTQNEIAKTLGISQVQVSRLEKKILKRLKRQLD